MYSAFTTCRSSYTLHIMFGNFYEFWPHFSSRNTGFCNAVICTALCLFCTLSFETIPVYLAYRHNLTRFTFLLLCQLRDFHFEIVIWSNVKSLEHLEIAPRPPIVIFSNYAWNVVYGIVMDWIGQGLKVRTARDSTWYKVEFLEASALSRFDPQPLIGPQLDYIIIIYNLE